MDDDHDERKEEQPSTSKNETNKEKDEPQERRRQRDDEYDDRERDDCTESETSGSFLSSVRSRLEMRADARPDIPKPPNGKREKPERKKRVTRGRVSKRRRSVRRHYIKRVPKKHEENRKRDPSVSTVFSRISSRSGSDSASCRYCGHRCCGRRLTDTAQKEIKRRERRQLVSRITNEMRAMKQETSSNKTRGKQNNTKLNGVQKRKGIIIHPEKLRGKGKSISYDKKRVKPNKDESRGNLVLNEACSGMSEGNQVGSACKMLSPLFITTNVILEGQAQENRESYREITPEMIYQTLRKLQKWRQFASLDSILTDIKFRYPVNPNQEELVFELVEKLRIAEIAGIVIQAQIKDSVCWCLTCELQKRGLNINHVTLFWQAYGDTLTGVKKKTTIVNHVPMLK